MLTSSTIKVLWAAEKCQKLRRCLALHMGLDTEEAAEVEVDAFHILHCLAGAGYRAWHRGAVAHKLVSVVWMLAFKINNDEGYDNVVHHVHGVFHDFYPDCKHNTITSLCRQELSILLKLQWRCMKHHIQCNNSKCRSCLLRSALEYTYKGSKPKSRSKVNPRVK